MLPYAHPCKEDTRMWTSIYSEDTNMYTCVVRTYIQYMHLCSKDTCSTACREDTETSIFMCMQYMYILRSLVPLQGGHLLLCSKDTFVVWTPL